MRGIRCVAMVVLGVAFAGACGDDDRPQDATSGSRPTAGVELYRDDFERDTGDWDLIDGSDGSAQLEQGDYVWEFPKGSEPKPHFLPTSLGEQFDAGELQMLDVIVRAEVTIEGGDAAFGVFCRESKDSDADFQWYEFILRDGFAAIRIADTEGNLETLAQTDEVEVTDGEPVTIDGSCVDVGEAAELTFVLGGQPILSVTHDEPLGNGAPGLQAYEAHNAEEPTALRWHEFSVTEGTSGAGD